MISSIVETDYTTPSLRRTDADGGGGAPGGGYWYYTRHQAGESRPRYCRAPLRSDDDGDDDDGHLYPPDPLPGWDAARSSPVLPGEETYLDVEELAGGMTFLAVGAVTLSPDQGFLAYSLDPRGNEVCEARVRELSTGNEWTLLEGRREEGDGGDAPDENQTRPLECDGSLVWDEAGGLFWVRLDGSHRPHRLYHRRVLDGDGRWIDDQSDELLFEEDDGLYSLRISKSFDGRYLLVRSGSKETSEVRYVDIRPECRERADDDPDGKGARMELRTVAPRSEGVVYRVGHCRGHWLVQTNLGDGGGRTPNLGLRSCRVGDGGMGRWEPVTLAGTGEAAFDGGHGRSLDGVTVFTPADSSRTYAVATGREDGLPQVWVLDLDVDDTDGDDADASALSVSSMVRLGFPESACDTGIGPNRDPSLPYVALSYDSLVTPPSTVAVDLSDPSARRVLKTRDVPGYDPDDYACDRTIVRSRDGEVDIPVSLVYRRDALRGGEGAPTHLLGYGSYGASIECSFRSTRLPLLNRGMVCAIAHVRGGGELGRPWYESAKYLTKKRTFEDFVDVASWLVGRGGDGGAGGGVADASRLSCEGRSAGGLLVGAALNMNPGLFRAAIMGVPFVDVAATMVDSTIPLTVAEWQEWGNPNEEEFFDYIMSYSPINNVKEGAVYPACLITGGLFDPRVQFWECAKYAAELRHTASDESGRVLFKTEMTQGHFAGSDRYKFIKDLAFEYAFLLDSLGMS